MNPFLVHRVESQLYQTLSLIPQYPTIPPKLDVTSQAAITAYKDSIKDWLKQQHPAVYKQPIIPELTNANWAEVFGLDRLSAYATLPELLIVAPQEIPYLRLSLNYPCGWELERLQRHNAKFLRQLWKYFNGGRNTLLKPSEWEVLVLLHDLGKPRAVERSYQQGLSGKQQKADNDKVREIFWTYLQPDVIQRSTRDIIDLILEHDVLIFEYLSQPESSPQALLASLQSFDQESGCSFSNLVQTFYAYYVCDGSTYTVEAGGQPSFDFQFLARNGQLELWSPFAQKWQAFLALLS